MTIDFSYYLSVFWRRFHYFSLIAIFFTVLGVALAVMLPAEYETRARLLVESAQIPDKLAASTVQTVAMEELEVIQQRMLTRQNLTDLANRFSVFPEDAAMSADAVVGAMRARTTFKITTGKNQATFLDVSFSGSSPTVVAQVTNELVTLILNENVRMRTGLAGDTLSFFEEEAKRLSSELDRQSAELLKFRSENADALPENREYLTSRQATLSDAIRNYQTQIETLQSQKRGILDVFAATGTVESGADQSPEQQALVAAQQALAEALLTFSRDNPKVRLLEARVQQLSERALAAEAARAGSADAEAPAADVASGPRGVVDAQVAEIEDRIRLAEDAIVATQEELDKVEASLQRIPSNAVVLDSLTRNFENTQSQYNQAVARLSTAEIGERVESLGKGQRITVVEQATVPNEPVRPNRKLIAVAGAGAGVSLGLGLIVLLELLNRSIRRPVEISDKLGIAAFGVVPFIRTEAEVRLRRMLTVGLLLAVVIGVPLAVWAMHTYVTPLDHVFERVANRFGMSIAP